MQRALHTAFHLPPRSTDFHRSYLPFSFYLPLPFLVRGGYYYLLAPTCTCGYHRFLRAFWVLPPATTFVTVCLRHLPRSGFSVLPAGYLPAASSGFCGSTTAAACCRQLPAWFWIPTACWFTRFSTVRILNTTAWFCTSPAPRGSRAYRGLVLVYRVCAVLPAASWFTAACHYGSGSLPFHLVLLPPLLRHRFLPRHFSPACLPAVPRFSIPAVLLFLPATCCATAAVRSFLPFAVPTCQFAIPSTLSYAFCWFVRSGSAAVHYCALPPGCCIT